MRAAQTESKPAGAHTHTHTRENAASKLKILQKQSVIFSQLQDVSDLRPGQVWFRVRVQQLLSSAMLFSYSLVPARDLYMGLYPAIREMILQSVVFYSSNDEEYKSSFSFPRHV